MSTPIKRIEKDFLLKVLFDEQLPVMVFYNKTEYTVVVDKPPKQELLLKSNKPINGLRLGQKLSMVFDYRGQIITFTAKVILIKETTISVEAPEYLYKNLDRSYSRVPTPSDLIVQLTFHGDRYNLNFPKIQEYEQDDIHSLNEQFDPKDIKQLINQLSFWSQENSSGYKLMMFKDNKPTNMEEKIIAETGKALFIPSTQTDLPQIDPYPKKKIITEDIFKRFLESSGVDKLYVEDALARFIKTKRDAGIYSDAWVPILFQEYVIGYIHLWIEEANKPPFDFSILDTLYQFTKVLSFSLKVHGYFDKGKVKKESFQGRVVDISASGMLFAYPHSSLSSSFLVDSELDVELITPKRSIKTSAKIVRRYNDTSMGYFGCRFVSIEPEDLRFLFEFIYGRPFTDQDASFIAGKV
ncbi:PilZ domain-containing protein [Gracilinema caldarium]|uniref:Type IV pilus assembly PilZ n=1 Tax=Gracilinema caldarium (strain ATCC 51460 / DSM 7334 / H1) TaxID=744872 RepID=F8EZ07_GRAC1|nr:PilZ domain-containing protein [Gracilinema caldarium]AEJ19238.1 type IV pilus assembly PilZ [Gracilinema caldarium DSM 7334]